MVKLRRVKGTMAYVVDATQHIRCFVSWDKPELSTEASIYAKSIARLLKDLVGEGKNEGNGELGKGTE